MILTVTLNTSVDLTVQARGLAIGTTVRGQLLHRRAGGKGLNLSLCLAAMGLPSTALGLVGPDRDGWFRAELEARGVAPALVAGLAHTRENITYLDPDTASVTHVQLPGGAVSAQGLQALRQQLAASCAPGNVAVLAGSLPPGLDPTALADLAALAARGGARVVVDSHGEALRAALEVRPDLIKPNLEELQRLLGADCEAPPQVVEAAAPLLDRAGAVLVSLGANGALYLDRAGAWWARVAVPRVVNTVGCGDALLAGFLAEQGKDAAPEACLAAAVAWGGASAMREVSGDLQPDDVAGLRDQVELQRLS